MAFDPDQFLAKVGGALPVDNDQTEEGTPSWLQKKPKDRAGFDPDAFLAKVATSPPEETRPLRNTGGDMGKQIQDAKTAIADAPESLPARAVRGALTLATDAADASTLGYYSKVRNGVAGAIADKLPGVIAPDTVAATIHGEDKFNDEHPLAANTARGVGYVNPYGVGGLIGKSVEGAGKIVGSVAPKVVSEFLATRPLTSAFTKGSATGAAVGGSQTLGEDVAAGVPLKDALADAGDSASAGLGLGAGLSTASAARRLIAGDSLTNAAKARGLKQQTSDLVGTKETGRAIATDIKKIGRAIDPIRAELSTTKGLEISDAARTDPDAAITLIDDHLKNVTKERTPDYKKIDKATGNVRSGDFVQHIEDTAQSLEDTGHGKDAAVAAELRKAADRIKNAGTWGGSRGLGPIDPAAPFNADYSVGQYLDLMTKAGQRAQALADIGTKPEFRQPTGFNPDAVVPTTKLRAFVTDMQNTAYDNMGGINGTNAFKKAAEVAHVGEDFLNAHLDKAKAADPQAAESVDRIRAMNKQIQAWLTVRNALETRVGKVDTADMSISPSTKLQMGLAAAASAVGSPVAALSGLAATKIAPPVIAAADRAVTRGLAARAPSVTPPPVSPVAIARLIQAAHSPGATRAKISKMAEDDGVPPEIAANVAQSNGLFASSEPPGVPAPNREELARQAASDPDATPREKARALQILGGR